jgi:hypothetical protein
MVSSAVRLAVPAHLRHEVAIGFAQRSSTTIGAAPLPSAGTVLHIIGIHDNRSANRRHPLDEADFPRLVEDGKVKPAASTAAQAPPQP